MKMLRLQDNEVIYNNSENLGLVQDMNFIESGFSINLPDGSMTFIPEEDSTANEKEVFSAYHEYYKETGGIKPKEEISLEQLKANKIKELDTACTDAILFGFTYNHHGTDYLLGFDITDQANLTGTIAILSACTEPITWKVKGQLIFLEFTKDEFLQMGLVAKIHKETLMQKYFGLCGRIQACTDIIGVDAIVW